jgi:hypothetical protein
LLELNCDTFAKEEWIDVLVTRGGRTRQTLLFEYVPATDALPVIKSVGANEFKISVPRISSLRYRRDRWESLSLDYDIGIIDYLRKGIRFEVTRFVCSRRRA